MPDLEANCSFSCPDEGADNRMVRARSLSKINGPLPQRQIYLDTSEEEEGFRYPVYQLPQLPPRRRSRASSQENVNQPPPVCVCVCVCFCSWSVDLRRCVIALMLMWNE